MRKVIFGSMMMMTGVISMTLITVGGMVVTKNGYNQFLTLMGCCSEGIERLLIDCCPDSLQWMSAHYRDPFWYVGYTPLVVLFIMIVAGLGFCITGLIEKKDENRS